MLPPGGRNPNLDVLFFILTQDGSTRDIAPEIPPNLGPVTNQLITGKGTGGAIKGDGGVNPYKK